MRSNYYVHDIIGVSVCYIHSNRIGITKYVEPFYDPISTVKYYYVPGSDIRFSSVTSKISSIPSLSTSVIVTSDIMALFCLIIHYE